MKTVRIFFADIYHFLLSPLYKRIKYETSQEIQRINQLNLDSLQEIQRINQINLESQARTQQHISDEFIKMYKIIDDIKCDRVDVKLNVTIVNELIKIYQSLEALKHEQTSK